MQQNNPSGSRKTALFTKENAMEQLATLLRLVLGTAIYSFSVQVFYSPAKLIAGGVTGVAQLLNFSMNLPTSLMIIVINIPLFLIALIFVDRTFTIFSLAGMLLVSLFVQLFSGLRLEFDSVLTSVVLGGMINGIGQGIIYRNGTSIGGSDIISKIIQRKFSGNMAYTGLAINAVVVGFSATIFGLDQAVLTLCAMFISSKVNTLIIDGIDHRRALFIITAYPNEIAHALHDATGHGATILKGEGTYTHNDQSVLYSVISKRQLAKAKRVIRDIDPNAFFTITVVTGVYGHGHEFKSVSHDIQ